MVPIKHYLRKKILFKKHKDTFFKRMCPNKKLNIFMFFQREIVWDEELKEIVAIEDYFV
jgi:hypothetical protein